MQRTKSQEEHEVSIQFGREEKASILAPDGQAGVPSMCVFGCVRVYVSVGEAQPFCSRSLMN